jgi:hypothetical protein
LCTTEDFTTDELTTSEELTTTEPLTTSTDSLNMTITSTTDYVVCRS